MSEADKSYGLLSETSAIEETRNPARQRHLPAQAALDWLRAGWRDLLVQPGLSLAYGVAVFLITLVLAWALIASERDYILFPAIAGYMIVAPVLAIGLYEKSRALEAGEQPTLGSMLLVRPRAGAQIFFTGLLLCLLMLLWNRAAVLIYALFFGVRPFPGLDRGRSASFSRRRSAGRCSSSGRSSAGCSRPSGSRSACSRSRCCSTSARTP